jgi:nitrite reductase (NADH) small subunit
MQPLNWTTVCDLDDIAPNTGVCALFDEQQVAIFRIGKTEQVYAIDNVDPFGKASVLSRGLIGDCDGDIVVASPLYKQQFKLKNGQCIEDKSVKLKTFAIRAHRGQIQLGLPH